MEQLEKVEKLRERANVSYEEAKEALEASNWDLLDAIVYLEQNGKTIAPNVSSFTTNSQQQPYYTNVPDSISYQKPKNDNGFFSKMGRLFKKFLKACTDSDFVVTQKDKEIFKVPVWFFLVMMFIGWHLLLVVMFVALFFDCHYSFTDSAAGVNGMLNKVNEFTDKVKDEYEKL